MKNNLKIGASLVGLIALTAPAFAADAVAPAPPQVYVPPAPVAPAGFDWSGLYAGVEAGYGWGDLEDTGGALGGDIDADGGLAGVFAGYNADLGGYVIGGEVDALWSGMGGTNGTNEGEINWLSSARVRAGVDVGRILIYGTAGLAVGGVEVTGPGVDVSNTQVGWTAGGGADVAISDSMFLRGEYQYVDLGSDDFGAAGEVDTTAHTLRAGIGIKF
ncbi:MAG: porin family protein [Bauldia sp.]|nr:porin family protein [Bauldia sp.]